MDVQKLLKVVDDIVAEVQQHDLVTRINNIVAQLSQNTPQGYNEAQALRNQLDESYRTSITSSYTPSMQEIFDRIGADRYLGSAAQRFVQDMFTKNPLELIPALTEYVEKLNQYLTHVRNLRSSLTAVGIQSYSSDAFEIGFIVPQEISNLQTMSKKFQMWDKFLGLASEIAGEEVKPSVIARVNNGNVEFFIVGSAVVVPLVSKVLKRGMELFKDFQEIQINKENIKGLKLDNEHKRLMLEALDAGLKQKQKTFIEETVDELMKDKKVKPERQEEVRTHMEHIVRIVLSDVNDGVEIEINPPTEATVGEPESPDSTAPEVQVDLLALNKGLKELYSRPLEQRRLPFRVEVEDILADGSRVKRQGKAAKADEG